MPWIYNYILREALSLVNCNHSTRSVYFIVGWFERRYFHGVATLIAWIWVDTVVDAKLIPTVNKNGNRTLSESTTFFGVQPFCCIVCSQFSLPKPSYFSLINEKINSSKKATLSFQLGMRERCKCWLDNQFMSTSGHLMRYTHKCTLYIIHVNLLYIIHANFQLGVNISQLNYCYFLPFSMLTEWRI